MKDYITRKSRLVRNITEKVKVSKKILLRSWS